MSTDPAAPIVRALRTARASTAREERSRLLRDAAEHLVELRAHYVDPNTGDPDWTGRSYEYRKAVREIYAAAGLPREGQSSLKSAIRYHIGNALRERLDKTALDEAGLLPSAPRERGYLFQMKRAGTQTDTAIQDTIAEIAGLTSRLNTFAPPKHLTTSDYGRLVRSIQGLHQWTAAIKPDSD